jgi:hypothetical protein
MKICASRCIAATVLEYVLSKILTCSCACVESPLVRRSKHDAISTGEYQAMNTETFGTLQGKHNNLDALAHRRAMIIKKARESVRLSHQRMHSRARKFCM